MPERNVSEFKALIKDLVATSQDAYNKYSTKRISYSSETVEEIKEIIASGSASQIINLSEKFVANSSLYQRILAYFSNFLTYDVFITPKKITSKSINEKKYFDNYKKTCFFADTTFNPKLNLPRITFQMLVYGAYYGLYIERNEYEAIIKDLPNAYCRSRFKTYKNINVLEFDMAYFDTITDEVLKKQALAEFPKEFEKGYRAYKSDINQRWFTVSPEIGIAFFYRDQNKPFFVGVIPTIADLEEYRGLEKELDKQDLEKILYQKVPIDKEGNFLLDNDEIIALHRGTARMLSTNSKIDVLTTFLDVELLSLGDKTKADRDNLEKMERSVYTEAGVSRLLFAGDSATSVNLSIMNDLSFVLDLAEQYSNWLTYQTNLKYAEGSKYFFEVSILPVSNYNRKDMLEIYLKTAQYGYSKILVGIVSGVKQSALLDLIDLENNLMGLHDKMMPLQSSHTQTQETSEEGGRPAKETEDKKEQTIKNEESV